MITGIIICLISSLLFTYQMRKDHVKRNVIMLFFALGGMIAGVWFIFDALLIKMI